MTIEVAIKQLQELRNQAYDQITEQRKDVNPNQYIIEYCEGKIFAFTCAINRLIQAQYTSQGGKYHE